MKKTILPLALLTAVLLLTAPVRADVIDDDLEWSSIIGAIPEEEPVPEPVEEPTPAEEQPAQNPAGNTNRPASKTPAREENTGTITAEAEFISFPVIGLAAGLFALAVTLLIRSIARIRREDRFEKEHLHR